MVGSVGCCCACCSEATSTWSETFASTPVADGNPFDVVRNITAPGCRSYPFSGSAKKIRTSQLHINADGSTPLYLGFNGPRSSPFVRMKAYWTDDTASYSQTPKMQLWSMVVPGSKTLANEMFVMIDSRLIPVFGSTEIELGLKARYRKQVFRNAITGVAQYQYRIDVESYKKTGNGSPVIEATRTTGWGQFAYHIILGFQWQFVLSLTQSDCTSVTQSRGFQIAPYFLCDDLLNPGFCTLVNQSVLSYNGEFMDCYLGWKTDVTWGVIDRAAGSGIYNFGSHYIRWYGANWGA